jgi:hypothetical protein
MIDRRFFLKLTGLVAAGGALNAIQMPAYAEPEALQAPGTYQFSGSVRLQDPVVEISGISNSQRISWTAGALGTPVASFTSFERFERPWRTPTIQVRGGQLEALKVTPLEFV